MGGGGKKLIKIKRGEYTSLFSKNPVLQDGQPCIATNKKITIGGYVFQGSQFVIGDGSTAFNSLPSVDLVQGNTSISGYIVDGIIDQGTSGIWTWRKWSSGISECWGIENTAPSAQQVEGGMYYSVKYVDFPKNLFIATPCTTVSAHGNWIGGAMTGTALIKTTYQGYLYTPTSAGHTQVLQTMIHARGRWK